MSTYEPLFFGMFICTGAEEPGQVRLGFEQEPPQTPTNVAFFSNSTQVGTVAL